MRRAEEYRYVHRWFVAAARRAPGAPLERRMREAVAGDVAPVRDGLVDELLPTLLYAHQLALGMEHTGAGDVWIASGAIELIEELWPLVASLGWPAPRTAVRGVREGWLQCLESGAAQALRDELEDLTEEAWRTVPREDLAAALAHDAIDTGRALTRLGDPGGEVARGAGRRFLGHLAKLGAVRQRWAPVAEAVARRESR